MPGWLTWLTPARRKAVYGSLALVGALLVIAGQVTDAQVAPWLTVADSGLALVALLMASAATRRPDYARIYSSAAVLLAALVAAGALRGDLGDQLTQALAAIAAAAPMIVAYLRTDAATASGAPVVEVVTPSADTDGVSIAEPVALPAQPPVTVNDTEAEVRRTLHRKD